MDGDRISGFNFASVVVLAPADESKVDLSRGHELVHVVQHDFAYLAWERPIESWGWSRVLDRNPPVDLGLLRSFLLQPFVGPLRSSGPVEDAPYDAFLAVSTEAEWAVPKSCP